MGELLYTSKVTISGYSFDSEAKYSFLAVMDPLTPFVYRRDGKEAESKLIQGFNKSKARIPHLTGDRSEINEDSFLEYFVYIEFYLNQLLKICLVDEFSPVQWMKLELVVGNEAMSLRAKMEIIKRLDTELWNLIKPGLSELQSLRNNMAHNPVGPFRYKDKPVDWNVLDKDITTLTTNILTAYKDRQGSLIEFMKSYGINIEDDDKG